LENVAVPPSAAIAAMATKRYATEGYHQPYAGAKFPLMGVRDVAHRFNGQDQDVLNPLGVNVVRSLRGKGVCVWAMRSRSADPMYRFATTRVIFNVLNGTLRSGFDYEIFSSIDSAGVRLMRIAETARSVCRRMWIAGALFGETEAEAFVVRCNF
jgi:phage tail sheath protein FI